MEQSLRNNKVTPPSNARALLEFLETQLPHEGLSAERRFLGLFDLICDRIYGPVQGKDANYKHQGGGWLAEETPWRQPMGSSTSNGSPRSSIINQSVQSTTNLSNDPVVTLLGGSGRPYSENTPLQESLVVAISRVNRKRGDFEFEFNFEAIPKAIQDAWLALIEASFSENPSGDLCTANDMILFGELLQRHHLKQDKLRRFKQQGAQAWNNRSMQPRGLSPRGIPTMNPSTFLSNSVSPTEGEQNTEPTVSLSMLEKYLFLFFRYPLYAPTKQALPSSVQNIPGVHMHRLPTPPQSRRGKFGDKVYQTVYQRMLLHFLPIGLENSFAFDSETELFLRVLIAFWMESSGRLAPTAKVVDTFRRHRGSSVSLDLNAAYDMVKPLRHNYKEVPLLVLQGVHSLITRLLLDPHLDQPHRDSRSALNSEFCLTPTMVILQQPLYNYIRSNLRFAEIHVANGPFHYVLNNWLTWCEPWNVRRTKSVVSAPRFSLSPRAAGKRELATPRFHEQSRYSDAWEPYVAANVYMYVVPLAIFVRRARELDLSAAKFERSRQMLLRVFRVFSPQVIQVLANNLEQPSREMAHHAEILGKFAPKDKLTLESLKTDLKLLFEEIDRAHLSKETNWIDAIFQRFESASNQEKNVLLLVEKAKMIARLPPDAHLRISSGVFSGKREATKKESFFKVPVPDRLPDGSYSAAGLEALLEGHARSDLRSPDDYVGDRMRAEPDDYESEFAVYLLVWLSDTLNDKLGVDKNGADGYRINLRFLADYRNAFWSGVLFLLLLKILHVI